MTKDQNSFIRNFVPPPLPATHSPQVLLATPHAYAFIEVVGSPSPAGGMRRDVCFIVENQEASRLSATVGFVSH
jgi:hypothetical protein